MLELGLNTTKCPYCDSKINDKTKTKDHIIPQNGKGNGSNEYQNLLWVCGSCNNIIKRGYVYGKKNLPNKVKKDSKGKFFIESIDDRKNYINGIRGEIQKTINDPTPIR